MALVRVYCGLASADSARPASTGSTLVAAVVDDVGRLLDVCELGDDPAGYARLDSRLVARTGGHHSTAIATDNDDHFVVSLLTAAGNALAVADDDTVDDFAERLADDGSADQSAPDRRRAVGLARALQSGSLSATVVPTSRDFAGHRPVLAAHSALLAGRQAAAAALREVLRELYPAALRAYPDPADPIALAVLATFPEPGRLVDGSTGSGDDASASTDLLAAGLAASGVADASTVTAAIAALRVAVSEPPQPANGPATVAEAVGQAVAAVRACDAGCQALVQTLTSRTTTPVAVATQPGSASQAKPATAGAPHRAPMPKRRTASPRPLSAPPAAPSPVAPPPAAPPPLATQHHSPAAGPEAAPQPVPPPGVAAAEHAPAAPTAPAPTTSPTSAPPAQRGTVPPAEAGEPFRATLTTAAINSARAERQRRAANAAQPAAPEPAPKGFSATDHSVPVPTPRPEPAPPGSRANWPLVTPADDDAATLVDGLAPAGSGVPDQSSSTSSSRITPPWLADDLPPEPPMLRLVEPPPLADRALHSDRPTGDEHHLPAPSLRLVDADAVGRGSRSTPDQPTESFAAPASDDRDGDLLIFAAARSAWFSGQPDDSGMEWGSVADSGWQAAEQAARPAIGEETRSGLPKRVPQANLVPGSPLRDERPVQIVRDPARIAQHTTGYFQGWRRGQEIGGFAVGGRPGREAAGGWDFSRDDATEENHDFEYRSARH